MLDLVADTPDSRFFEQLYWPGARGAIVHCVPDRFATEFAPQVDASEQLFVRGALAPAGSVIRIPPLART